MEVGAAMSLYKHVMYLSMCLVFRLESMQGELDEARKLNSTLEEQRFVSPELLMKQKPNKKFLDYQHKIKEEWLLLISPMDLYIFSDRRSLRSCRV